MTIRDRLKELRKRKKVSQKQLAKDAGLPYYTLVALENERSQIPLITTLIKLAKYFGITVDQLIKDVEFKER